jgi:hypothetical protein
MLSTFVQSPSDSIPSKADTATATDETGILTAPVIGQLDNG